MTGLTSTQFKQKYGGRVVTSRQVLKEAGVPDSKIKTISGGGGGGSSRISVDLNKEEEARKEFERKAQEEARRKLEEAIERARQETQKISNQKIIQRREAIEKLRNLSKARKNILIKQNLQLEKENKFSIDRKKDIESRLVIGTPAFGKLSSEQRKEQKKLKAELQKIKRGEIIDEQLTKYENTKFAKSLRNFAEQGTRTQVDNILGLVALLQDPTKIKEIPSGLKDRYLELQTLYKTDKAGFSGALAGEVASGLFFSGIGRAAGKGAKGVGKRLKGSVKIEVPTKPNVGSFSKGGKFKPSAYIDDVKVNSFVDQRLKDIGIDPKKVPDNVITKLKGEVVKRIEQSPDLFLDTKSVNTIKRSGVKNIKNYVKDNLKPKPKTKPKSKPLSTKRLKREALDIKLDKVSEKIAERLEKRYGKLDFFKKKDLIDRIRNELKKKADAKTNIKKVESSVVKSSKFKNIFKKSKKIKKKVRKKPKTKPLSTDKLRRINRRNKVMKLSEEIVDRLERRYNKRLGVIQRQDLIAKLTDKLTNKINEKIPLKKLETKTLKSSTTKKLFDRSFKVKVRSKVKKIKKKVRIKKPKPKSRPISTQRLRREVAYKRIQQRVETQKPLEFKVLGESRPIKRSGRVMKGRRQMQIQVQKSKQVLEPIRITADGKITKTQRIAIERVKRADKNVIQIQKEVNKIKVQQKQLMKQKPKTKIKQKQLMQQKQKLKSRLKMKSQQLGKFKGALSSGLVILAKTKSAQTGIVIVGQTQGQTPIPKIPTPTISGGRSRTIPVKVLPPQSKKRGRGIKITKKVLEEEKNKIIRPKRRPSSRLKKKKQPLAHNVYARPLKKKGQKRKPKQIRINKKPLSRRDAIRMRNYVLDTSLSRSGSIKPTKGKPSKPSIKVPQRNLNKKFRDYKIVKGKKVNLRGGGVIEKRRNILDTRAEKKKITLKRRIAQLQKKKSKQKRRK